MVRLLSFINQLLKIFNPGRRFLKCLGYKHKNFFCRLALSFAVSVGLVGLELYVFRFEVDFNDTSSSRFLFSVAAILAGKGIMWGMKAERKNYLIRLRSNIIHETLTKSRKFD